MNALLAKRFHVNAKTLSKALTDLAAEGLLDRSIGRGTFVKGTVPSAVGTKRWLIICDTVQLDGELVKQIRNLHNDIELVTDMTAVRPSFINQFSAVIDLSTESRDAMIRDLVVRNIPLVVVWAETIYVFNPCCAVRLRPCRDDGPVAIFCLPGTAGSPPWSPAFRLLSPATFAPPLLGIPRRPRLTRASRKMFPAMIESGVDRFCLRFL